MTAPRVAVVGATGAVGRTMLEVLEQRDFPLSDLVALASERSEGKRLPFRDDTVTVRALRERWFEGVDIALVSAGGAVSKAVLPAAAAAGTVSIDNSSAFRMDPDVPLVIPEINAEDVWRHRGIVANGNCTAITALVPLGPLHRRFRLRFLVTSSYQSVSGAGMRGVRELAEQVGKLHEQVEELIRPDAEALPKADVFAAPIAFNVVALCEKLDPEGSGFTTEELKMGSECRKVLGIEELPVYATAIRVPTVVGHGVSVFARFAHSIDAEAAREALGSAPGVRVVDDADTARLTPLAAAGGDDVLVGRIRHPADDDHAVMFFAAADNLRKGAALNAVQIAELLVASQVPA